MNINIQSVKFKTDSKLEDFIHQKVRKLVNNIDVTSCDVTLKLENNDQHENKITEIQLNIPSGELFAKKQAPSFEEATDLAVDALKSQIAKFKDKLRN